MKLPHNKNSHIPKGKLEKYLLSETHPVGKHKANLFRKIGYTKENTAELKKALLAIAHDNKIKEIKQNPYGTNYAIIGNITTPTDDLVTIKTIWFLRKGAKRPKLITAYPHMIK